MIDRSLVLKVWRDLEVKMRSWKTKKKLSNEFLTGSQNKLNKAIELIDKVANNPELLKTHSHYHSIKIEVWNALEHVTHVLKHC